MFHEKVCFDFVTKSKSKFQEKSKSKFVSTLSRKVKVSFQEVSRLF
jgi:hypothetical protein